MKEGRTLTKQMKAELKSPPFENNMTPLYCVGETLQEFEKV